MMGAMPSPVFGGGHVTQRQQTCLPASVFAPKGLRRDKARESMAPNAVNYAAVFIALILFALSISVPFALRSFGAPGGLSFFLCGQLRAFFTLLRL